MELGGSIRKRACAQTAIIGLVLLIGIVSLASLAIFMGAGETGSNLQQQAETERVEAAFVELGQQLRTASSSQDVSRTVALDVERGGGRLERTDAGVIRVEVEGNAPIERSLGSLEYAASDGTRIVYQAGGVWRVSDETVRTVSEPKIHFSDGTLTFPVRG